MKRLILTLCFMVAAIWAAPTMKAIGNDFSYYQSSVSVRQTGSDSARGVVSCESWKVSVRSDGADARRPGVMGPGAGKVSSQGGGKARLYATNRDSGVRVEVAVLAQAAAAEVELPGQEITVGYQHSVFDTGDGSTLTCPRTTPWVKGRQPVGASSPTCGHVYHQPGHYTVQATHHWTLTWHGAGQSGTIPLSTTANHPLKIEELISVITHRHHD